MIKKLFLSIIITLFASTLMAKPSPMTTALGSSKAKKGGTFYRSILSEPPRLNPITYSDLYATYLFEYTMDSLMGRNLETREWEPMLAESVELIDGGNGVEVKLRKGAKWHDGKPVTVKDVKFSYDSIMDKRYDTASRRPYFENIDSAKIIDDSTVRFKFKKKYFGNYNVIAGLTIVPQHVYGDPKKKLNKVMVGAGPYKMGKYKKRRSITLDKNKDWWGFKDPRFKNAYNADKILFRFVKEDNVRLEMLKKGKIDLLPRMSPEMYVKKAVGKLWGSKVHKKKAKNKQVKGYSFVGWNLKNDLFKNRDVRVALAHLMNRDLMIKKFRFGMSLPATGPWYRQSPYAPKDLKPLAFDPAQAKKLLKKAGWKDSNKDGVLDKVINGKKKDFKFTLMFSRKDAEKYLTVYKEDLKKSGINMSLKLVEWNSFIKALDDKKFEAVRLGWGGGSIDNDPKQIWHTDSAKNQGSNFISYSNKKVDKLIDEGRKELDYNKRVKLWNVIYKEIAKDAPYVFMFNDIYEFYGHTDKMGTDKVTYNYGVGDMYWWVKK